MPSAMWLFCVAAPWPAAAVLLRSSNASSQADAPYRIRMRNYKNIQYHGDITLGGQVLPAIYDTGSYEILTLSAECNACKKTLWGTPTSVPLYDSSKSSTFESSGLKADHHFGSGSAHCRQDFETVVAGEASGPMAATGMPIWQVLDHTIISWNDPKFSAIVGLGRGERVPKRFVADGASDLMLLPKLGVKRFSLCIEAGGVDAPGWLTFNPAFSAALFKTVPVVGKVKWGVDLTEVKLGSVNFKEWGNANPCAPCGAIVDSGSSLIGASRLFISALNPEMGKLKSDCSNVDDLPDLTFNLGSGKFVLPARAWVLRDHSGAQPSCKPAFLEIQRNSELGHPAVVLGAPFLRYYYTVFDRNVPEALHFAKAGPGCEPSRAGASAAQLSSPVQLPLLDADFRYVRMSDV